MEMGLLFLGVGGIIAFIVWLVFFRKSPTQDSRSTTPPPEPRRDPYRSDLDRVRAPAPIVRYPLPGPHRVEPPRRYSAPLMTRRRYFRHDGNPYYVADGTYYHADGRVVTDGLILAGVAAAALAAGSYIANASEVEEIVRYHDPDPNSTLDGWVHSDYPAQMDDGVVSGSMPSFTGPGRAEPLVRSFDDPVLPADAIRSFEEGSGRLAGGDPEPIVTPLPGVADPENLNNPQHHAQMIKQFPRLFGGDSSDNEVKQFDQPADADARGLSRFERYEPAETPAIRQFAEAVEVIPDEPEVQEIEDREEPEVEDRDDD